MLSTILVCVVSLLLGSEVSAFHFVAPRLLRSKTTYCTTETQSAPAQKFHQVYIGNLPSNVNENDVTSLIKDKAGDTFKALRLAKDNRTGDYRGFGYIDFEQKGDAEAAVQALQGSELSGSTLKIDMALPKSERPKPERPPQENSCFIGNLDFQVTEDDVMNLCKEKLGEGVASKVRLATERETGRKRGFGHIDFQSPEEATRAIQVLSGVTLNGRELRIDHARRREDAPAPSGNSQAGGVPRYQRAPRQLASAECSVFLGNLAWEVTTDLLREMLDDIVGAGSYNNVRLATDNETGRAKGYAHVDFKDAATAERAVKELDGLLLNERPLRADMAQRKSGAGRSGRSFGSNGNDPSMSF